MARANSYQHVQAVQPGQINVQEHDVKTLPPDQLQRFATVLTDGDDVVRIAEALGEKLPCRGIVFHDKQSGSIYWHAMPSVGFPCSRGSSVTLVPAFF